VDAKLVYVTFHDVFVHFMLVLKEKVFKIRCVPDQRVGGILASDSGSLMPLVIGRLLLIT
jgi:hypothetical protein